MNSINWARVMAQIVYYVTAASRSASAAARFAVPTGQLRQHPRRLDRGTDGPADRPARRSASNSNDILTRWASRRARWSREPVVPTYSPSMDIQVSSNHERLLFELLGRDGAAHAELIGRFRADGAASAKRLADHARFERRRGSTTRRRSRSIRHVHDASGVLVDPHTAVGIGAAEPAAAGAAAPRRWSPGHRPPGEVPRRRRGGHRHPAAAARPPGRPVRPARALRALPADLGQSRP